MSLFDRKKKKKYDSYVGRRQGEEDLWHRWNKENRPEKLLGELLDSLDPLIEREAKRRMQGLGGSIPHAAVKGELRKNTVRALQLFDPTKGAKLQTHVHNNFMRATDFISTRRNSKYMPRTDVEKYQSFQNARELFKQETGQDATLSDMKQLLPKWPMSTLKRLDAGMGAEAFTGMGTGNLTHDKGMDHDKVRAAYHMMRGTMSEKERSFAELHYPAAGKKQLSVKQVAKKLGITESQAYRIKSTVEKKLKPIMRNG